MLTAALGIVWKVVSGFFTALFKIIVNVGLWLAQHPIVLVGLICLIVGLGVGHHWGYSADQEDLQKQIDALVKDRDDYNTALAKHKEEIEVASKEAADNLEAGKKLGAAEAQRTVDDYKQKLADAQDPKNVKHTIEVQKVYIQVPAKVDTKGKTVTPATQKQVEVMIENGSVVCQKLPSVTKDTINQLIDGANKWYAPTTMMTKTKP